MAKEGIIRMSKKEIKRVGIIEKVISRELTQVKASIILGICKRQVGRVVKGFKEEGIEGIVHKSRGMIGNHRNKKKDNILELYESRYSDFGPTFASEKLLERDKLRVNHETLRGWLLEIGEHEWQRKKRPHRKWRERRESFGEMVQMDGSHHDWLEERGPRLVLMGYVDDATGEKFGKFYLYEGTVPALGSFNEYINKYGIPLSVYLDKHSTYKTVRHQTIFEELNDKKSLTQFERAMEELGVEVIHAHSAPAKGRVENFFKTFQDRFVKEMRLANIKTLEGANKFLEGYLSRYNERFRVPAKNSVNLHRKKPPKYVLAAILCIKEKRSLRKDSTVYYDNRVFLVTNSITRRAKEIEIEERLNGSIRIKYKGRYLHYKEVEPSMRVNEEEVVYKKAMRKTRKKRKSSIPAKNHPWRQYNPDHHIDPCDYGYVEKEEVLANV